MLYINRFEIIEPNPINNSIFYITLISANTQISLLLILMNQLWKFPSIFFYFFGWRRNRFCHHISVVLKISSHTSASRFPNRIVMLVVQRIMIFGLVVVEKRHIHFHHRRFLFFSFLYFCCYISHCSKLHREIQTCN